MLGNNGEACFNKYGSFPLHKPYCHEQALRILLYFIEMQANRYKRYIKPILSASIDFYIRIFVRVYTSPLEIKSTCSKISYVYQSCGCDSYVLQKIAQKRVKGGDKKKAADDVNGQSDVKNQDNVRYVAGRGPVVNQQCPDTGASYQMGGPIWSEGLHDMEAVGAILEELEENQE